jgi:archaellum component FlaC
MGVELKALSRQLDGAKDQIWGLREEKERLQSELTEVMFERGTLEKQVNRLIDEIQRLKNISTMGGIRGKTDIAYDDKLLKDAYEAMMKAPPGDVDQFINRQLEVAQNVARKQRDRLRERDKRIAELETRIRRLESTN